MYRLVLFTAVGIGLFLIIVFVQQRQLGSSQEVDTTSTTELEADYYFETTLSKHYDEQGRFDYQFSASRIEHFEEGDYTLVEAPRVSFYQEDGTPWLITARNGRSDTGNEKVELWDDVRVNRNSTLDPLQMDTQTLMLKMPSKTATTDDPVAISYPKGRVDAVGMRAFFDANKLELLSQVQVKHDPIEFE